MVEGYGKVIKYALLIANSIIFICGTILLSLGIWTVTDRTVMERLLGINLYLASAILLIITGTIVSVIALLGALGAHQEVKCLLKTYFCVLLALSIIISTIGGLGFTFRDQLDNRLQEELHKSMKLYGNDSHITETWDLIQSNFNCCGISFRLGRGHESWRRETTRFNSSIDGPFVPESCCRSQEDDPSRRACQGRAPRKDDTWTDGCYDKIKNAFKSHSLAIGLSAILAVLFIIFGLILSGTLFLIIRQNVSSSLTQSKRLTMADLDDDP